MVQLTWSDIAKVLVPALAGAILAVFGSHITEELRACSEARNLAGMLLMEVNTNRSLALGTVQAAEKLKLLPALRELLPPDKLVDRTIFAATLLSHGKLDGVTLNALHGFYANLDRMEAARVTVGRTPAGPDREAWHLETAQRARAAVRWADERQLIRHLERERERGGFACLLR